MDELSNRPAARLRVTTDPGDGRLTVEFAGELDIAGLADVEGPLAELLAREPQPVVIDLGGLQFLDSSGIAALIRIANRFDPVEIRHAGARIHRVLTVLGLASRFGLSDD